MKLKTTKQHLNEIIDIVEDAWGAEFNEIHRKYRFILNDKETPADKFEKTQELKDIEIKLEILRKIYDNAPEFTQEEIDSGNFIED